MHLITSEVTIAAGQSLLIDAENLTESAIFPNTNSNRMFRIEQGGTLAIHGLEVSGGKSSGNGGAILSAGDLTLFRGSMGFNRSVNGSGGALSATDGSRTCLSDTAFIGNDADVNGGAINLRNGEATLTRCSVIFNSAGPNNFGGAIENIGGTLALTDCRLSFNSVDGFGASGGALDNFNGSAWLTSCTLDSNEAHQGGGVLNQSGDHNLIGSGSATPAYALPSDTTGASNVGLLPLDNYGGPTQTHFPQFTSVANDVIALADSPLDVDQRGYPRPADGSFTGTYLIDIGAVETDPETTWASDEDGDGSPFGIEVATGTMPNSFEPNNNGITLVDRDATGAELFFGYNTNAAFVTAWIISRATSLEPDTWTEIYRYDGPTATEIVAPGEDFTVDYSTAGSGIDSNAPPGEAFYRLEAEFIPLPPGP